MENKKQLDEYVQTFFDEIKQYDFDLEKGTFNGYPVTKIQKYYDHIHLGVEGLEHEMNRYFEFIHEDYQLSAEESDEEFSVVGEIRKKLEEVEREIIQSQAILIASLYQLENKENLYKGIVNATKVVNTIIFAIHYVLDKYIYRENGVYYHETSIDKINFRTGNFTNSENPVSIPLETNKKLKLNLPKKEIAFVFMLLTEMKIINPASKDELYKFIENNFLFTDTSKGINNIATKDIKKITEAASNLMSYHLDHENNNFKKKFIRHYSDKIYDFIQNIENIDLTNFKNLP